MTLVPYFVINIIQGDDIMNLKFKYTDKLVLSLLNIEKYNTALEYLYLPTRVKQKMIYDAKLKKTHFSTSIEGNILSYNQVAKVIENKDVEARITPEQEVKNYWEALTFLEDSKNEKINLSENFIFELHDIIDKKKEKKNRINYRTPTAPGVLFAVYDSVTRRPEYIPPESKDITGLINELINWYNENFSLPPAILAAVFHYAFVSIHPFEDGNGRTARALASYILMINNYDLKGYNSFEEYYMSDLEGYYSSLQMGLPPLFYDGRENPPKLEIWLEYFCYIMEVNAQNIYDQALDVSKKENNILNNLNKKDIVLLRYCLENNISELRSKQLAELYNVTPRAITKWCKQWVEKGILIPSSGSTRVTAYSLSSKFKSLKVSDIGFTD